MRCSCRVCSTYMVQSEKGLESGCRCPECGNECHDCMGSAQAPMDRDGLIERMRQLTEQRRGENTEQEEQ